MRKSPASDAPRLLAHHPRLHGFVSSEAAGTDHYLPPEASERWFVPPERAHRRVPLFRLVDEFLRAPSDGTGAARLLLVLGGPGTGKTSFVLNYLVAHEQQGASARQPLTAIALAHPPAIERLAALESELRARSAVFLDGLEEDPRAQGAPGPARRLLELLALAADFQRVIVTASLESFPTPDALPLERLGFAPAAGDGSTPPLRVVELHATTPQQARQYIRSLFPFPSLRRRRLARGLTAAVPELGAQPLLLARIPDLIERGRPVAKLTEVYAALFDTWQHHERKWAEGIELAELARRLALRAYRGWLDGRGDRVPSFEAGTVAQELGLPWPLPFYPRAPIVIDAEGRAVFAHRTLLEYCFAKALLAMSSTEQAAWLAGSTLTWTPTMRSVALDHARAGAALAEVDLTGLGLSGLDLRRADLRGARLAGCELTSAQLCEADLSAAWLVGARLTQASLRGADLTGADLTGADLTGADLGHANLSGAELNAAIVSGANLRGTLLVEASLPASLFSELAPPGAELDGSVLVEPVTGMRLVWIPGGRFQMGSDDQMEESPVHWARVSSSWFGETPVTNRQYARFVEQTGHPQPGYWSDPRFSAPEQPVVGVSFEDALAFCRWLSAVSGFGVTLPTEAAWEYAARGLDRRPYPWGSEPPSSAHTCFGLDAMSGAPAPVGSCPAGRGPFGTLDQSGNVWEWCLDWWDALAYVKRAGAEVTDPLAQTGAPAVRVVRGGSWFFPAEDLRAAARARNEASRRADDLGFRVMVGARFWPTASIPPTLEVAALSGDRGDCRDESTTSTKAPGADLASGAAQRGGALLASGAGSPPVAGVAPSSPAAPGPLTTTSRG